MFLKKILMLDVKKFEKECINKIIKSKKKNDKYILTIINSNLSEFNFRIIWRYRNKKIISSLLEKEFTIPQILKESKVP